MRGGLCQDIIPSPNKKAAKLPSDHAKCPLCPFRLSLKCLISGTKKQKCALSFDIGITLRGFVPTVGICVSLPAGSVPAERLGRCECWHASPPQGRHRHRGGPERHLWRGRGGHHQCTQNLPAAAREVGSEPCTLRVNRCQKKNEKRKWKSGSGECR